MDQPYDDTMAGAMPHFCTLRRSRFLWLLLLYEEAEHCRIGRFSVLPIAVCSSTW